MKFTIRDMMWAVFLVCLFARWIAVDVVFRGKMVEAWRNTYVIQMQLAGRVKKLEQEEDRRHWESAQLRDVFERLQYLESLHDSQAHK